jgi:hypothetical protein
MPLLIRGLTPAARRRACPLPRAAVLLWTLVAGWLSGATATALEFVTLSRDGQTIHVSGRVEVEAQDGGVLLRAADGVLWVAQPDELVERRADDRPFQLFARQELARSLLNELPAGFRIHDTAHFLICYNTSTAYAEWCGALYERLYRAFTNFWTRKGLELTDPPAPLVALVFDRRSVYAEYARPELGEAADSIVGYYSLRSNRIMTFDLTGVERLMPRGRGVGTMARINQVLAQPAALPTVATIVHEATHQLAFNCGLHRRYADIPLWVSEGIALYFETPDLRSSRGWRGIGLNHGRLLQLRQYLRRRPADSLAALISDDQRFDGSRQTIDAYAESWGLCHFLLQRYPEQFVQYLRQLGEKEPLLYDTPDERRQLFQQCIGRDLAELDDEFVRYVDRLR